MEKLILIKLGGSVITYKDRPFVANEKAIRRLGKEIIEAKKKFAGKIIIGHGSGSFGHTLGFKYKTQEGIVNERSIKGAALVEDVAVQLNRIVVKNLLRVGLPVFSISPASFLTSKGKKPAKVFPDSVVYALEIGMLPLVYGDVVFDKKIGFTIFSTEKVFEALIAKLFKSYKILKVIHASDTAGVYDEKGKTIPVISPRVFKRLAKTIGGAKVSDVTGGMIHKVEESVKLAGKFGVESLVINGAISGELKKAILGRNGGTIICSS